MEAVIYTRQSLDAAATGLGVERQLKECQRHCTARGWTVSEVISDNDTSASKRGRPGYTRLLQLIESRSVDVVVILRIDRLLRLNDELEELINLSEQSDVTISTVEGDIQLSTPQGRLTARILVSVARNEMELKSARHKLANAQRAALGKPHHGGRRPFGYEADMVTIKEDEAELLREMAKRLIAGSGYKHIAYWLNEQGHRTTTGKLWYPVTVRNLLKKHRYAGIRLYNGVEYEAEWQGILDAATWQQLQHVMRSRRELAGDKPRGRKYLLTGLAHCGQCGLPLTGSLVQDRPGLPKRRIYICRGQRDTGLVRGCGSVRRNADALDWFVTEAVFYRLDTPELAKLLEAGEGKADIERLLNERSALQARLDGFADDYATGLLSKAQLARANSTARAELERLDREIDKAGLNATGLQLAAGESVRGAWEKADDGWRRQLLSLLVERVDVHRSAKKPLITVNGTTWRFDAEAVNVVWKS